MATGIFRATGADLGISITGIAGPGRGGEEKPVGLVYLGVARNGEERGPTVTSLGHPRHHPRPRGASLAGAAARSAHRGGGRHMVASREIPSLVGYHAGRRRRGRRRPRLPGDLARPPRRTGSPRTIPRVLAANACTRTAPSNCCASHPGSRRQRSIAPVPKALSVSRDGKEPDDAEQRWKSPWCPVCPFSPSGLFRPLRRKKYLGRLP